MKWRVGTVGQYFVWESMGGGVDESKFWKGVCAYVTAFLSN